MDEGKRTRSVAVSVRGGATYLTSRKETSGSSSEESRRSPTKKGT